MRDDGQNSDIITLSLWTPEGAPWVLSMSAGMEVFIGRYQRLKNFNTGGGLIRYSSNVMSGPPAASDKLL